MKIHLLDAPQVIMSNPNSRHNYFGWPSVTRLQNGKIAVVASGFRLAHVCPFGKMVISYSEDEGCTYTAPAAVIDTDMDDRDGGVVTFGQSGVIVTSFTNPLDLYRKHAASEYEKAYLASVPEAVEKKWLGSYFRISDDCGVTYGPILKSPVTSPHGPTELSDGTILWVGQTFHISDEAGEKVECVAAYEIGPNGSMTFVGRIDPIEIDGKTMLSSEPHAIELPDGSILVHIRVQDDAGKVFTIYQARSCDKGKNWTKPVPILSIRGGAPAHLFRHSSGVLLSTYGFRGSVEEPGIAGIRVMFSYDNGEHWEVDRKLFETRISSDLGYPATVELNNGQLLTVFYAREKTDGPSVIMQQKWIFEK